MAQDDPPAAAVAAGQHDLAEDLAAQSGNAAPVGPAGVRFAEQQLVHSVLAGDPVRTARARQSLAAALDAIDDTGDEEQWIQSSHHASLYLAEGGLHEDALDLNVRLCARLETTPDSELRTRTLVSALINLGNEQIALGRYRAALSTFARAEQVLDDQAAHHHSIDPQAAPDPQAPENQYGQSAANLAHSIAVAHAELGEIDLARASYQRALAVWDEIGAGDADRGYAIRGLAATLARTGRSQEALEMFADAMCMFHQAGETTEVDLTEIGAFQARLRLAGEVSAAELDRARATAERLPPSYRVSSLHNIGNALTDCGDYDNAQIIFHDIRAWSEQFSDPVSWAKATSSLAVVERHRGRPEQAISFNRAAHARYLELGLDDGIGLTEHNYALLIEEAARRSTDPAQAIALHSIAADHAIDALAVLDRHRHRLPTATDRHLFFANLYAPVPATAARNCMNAQRWSDLAAVVECNRIQPVLRDNSSGFLEPTPVAACHGSPPIGGTGTPVVLGELAEAILGPSAFWLGWWTDGTRLVRTWSTANIADADYGPLDRDALCRYAASLPIVDRPDIDAADRDPDTARVIATWRAASGPMLNDADTATGAATRLDDTTRAAVLDDDCVAEAFHSTADELLWPFTQMLLSTEVRTELLDAHAAGRRAALVLAPIPAFGRIPWAALPLHDPAHGTPPLLINAADIAVALPASLARNLGQPSSVRHALETLETLETPATSDTVAATEPNGTVILADPLGDLHSADTLSAPAARILGASQLEPATRHYLTHALAGRPRLLAIAGHVRPGTNAEPADTALMLEGPDEQPDPLTAAELPTLDIPPWCLVLGCDGAGAATGHEWTGVLTGLAWAGATDIATTTVPVIDDDITSALEHDLLADIQRDGPLHGLLAWQRRMSRRHRDNLANDKAAAPYRWATLVATRAATSPHNDTDRRGNRHR